MGSSYGRCRNGQSLHNEKNTGVRKTGSVRSKHFTLSGKFRGGEKWMKTFELNPEGWVDRYHQNTAAKGIPNTETEQSPEAAEKDTAKNNKSFPLPAASRVLKIAGAFCLRDPPTCVLIQQTLKQRPIPQEEVGQGVFLWFRLHSVRVSD